jgi:hypothetical protein
MGTRSLIGIYDKATREVTASYCHYDGYLSGVGATLVKSYNNMWDAATVACGGYISCLGEDYEESKLKSVNSDEAVNYASVISYMKAGFDDFGVDYLYLFDGEAWFFCRNATKIVGFEEVAINLENVEENS